MSGFVVDREECVGGACSGGGGSVGGFVGGSADWLQLVVLRKVEDESKQPQPSKRPQDPHRTFLIS